MDAEAERPLVTPLAPRLATFDPKGDLIGLAREIGLRLHSREEAAVDVFDDRPVQANHR